MVERIGRYDSFAEMLAQEDPQAIAPDVPPQQLLDVIQAIYPPEKEALGVVVLALVPGSVIPIV